MAAAPGYNGSRLEKPMDDYGGDLKIKNAVKQKKVNKCKQRERDLSGGWGGGRSRRQWAS